MNLKELGKKYNLVILDGETIQDLEEDLERSKEILEVWLKELNRMSTFIARYAKAIEVTKVYSERVEKLKKVLAKHEQESTH